MLQQALIALAVVAAGGYVTWTFMSMNARQRLLDWLARHRLFVDAARRHRARLSAPGCSNCASSAPAPIIPTHKR